MKKLFLLSAVLLLFGLISCGTNLDPEDRQPDVAISKIYGPLIGAASGGAGGAIDLLAPNTGTLTVPASELFDPVTNQTEENPLSVYVTASDELEVTQVELFYDGDSVGVWNKATDGLAFNNPFIFPKPGSSQASVAIDGNASGLVDSQLQAVATDSSGQTTESMPVSLLIDGSRPDLNFDVSSPDSPITTESTVTLTGSASDPETGIVAASLNGTPMEIDTNGTASAVQTLTSPTAGTNTVTLTATNGALIPNQAVFTFNVEEASTDPTDPTNPDGNTVPTVTLTANPSFGDAPLQVIFSATGQDEDGDELTYAWDFGNDAEASSGNTQTTTYSADGTYTATVTVDDGNGGTAEATTTVIVGDGGGSGGDNQSPTVAIDGEASQTVAPATALPLTATASDPDGDTLTYAWTAEPSTGVTFSAADAASTDATFASAGSYVVTLTVSDGNGGQASDTVNVTVGDGGGGNNESPTVSIGGEATRTVAVGTASALAATASDPDGDTITYAWTAEPSTGVTFSAATESETNVTFADAGSYTVTLTVSDGNGGQGTDSVAFTVGGDDNGGVKAVADTATTTSEKAATLEVLANDEPSAAELIIIIVTSPSEGGTVAISRDSKTILYTPKDGFTGEETFRYTVRDENDNRSTAQVTVQVE